MGGESRDVLEGHLGDLAVLTVRPDADQTGRSFELEFCDRLLHRDHAGLEQDGGHRNGVAAAHHGVLHLFMMM
jgi:hypothetical protein